MTTDDDRLQAACMAIAELKAERDRLAAEVERLTKEKDEAWKERQQLWDEGMEREADNERIRQERNGWHGVVKDCERVLKLEGTAESPLMSNLANACRDQLIDNARLREERAELLNAWQAFPGRSCSESEWNAWIAKMPARSALVV